MENLKHDMLSSPSKYLGLEGTREDEARIRTDLLIFRMVIGASCEILRLIKLLLKDKVCREHVERRGKGVVDRVGALEVIEGRGDVGRIGTQIEVRQGSERLDAPWIELQGALKGLPRTVIGAQLHQAEPDAEAQAGRRRRRENESAPIEGERLAVLLSIVRDGSEAAERRDILGLLLDRQVELIVGVVQLAADQLEETFAQARLRQIALQFVGFVKACRRAIKQRGPLLRILERLD